MSWAPNPERWRHVLSKGGKTLSPSMESALGAKHQSQEGACGAEATPQAEWLLCEAGNAAWVTGPDPLALGWHVERRGSWRPCTGTALLGPAAADTEGRELQVPFLYRGTDHSPPQAPLQPEGCCEEEATWGTAAQTADPKPGCPEVQEMLNSQDK